MRTKIEVIRNQDNELLMPSGDSRITIGYLDEVNGPGASEVPEFVPTRHELLQLEKYWTGVSLDISYTWFQFAQTSSTEIRLSPFAARRIGRIADLLGETVVSKAVAEAEDDFRKQVDPTDWDTFKNGDQEAWRKVQDRIHAALDAKDKERESSSLPFAPDTDDGPV